MLIHFERGLHQFTRTCYVFVFAFKLRWKTARKEGVREGCVLCVVISPSLAGGFFIPCQKQRGISHLSLQLSWSESGFSHQQYTEAQVLAKCLCAFELPPTGSWPVL